MRKQALLSLLLLACSKNDGDKVASAKPGDSAAEVTADKLFEGTHHPTLVGPFAQIKLGTSKATLGDKEVQRLEYIKGKEVSFFGYFEHESQALQSVTVSLPAGKARDVVTKAWGQPIDLEIRREPAALWLDPETHTRAVLGKGNDAHEQSLVISAYLPAKQFLGEGKDKLGFEKAPLLGATRADVLAAYPKELAGHQTDTLLFMKMAQTEYGDGNSQVELSVDKDGKIDRIQLWIPYGKNDKTRAEVLALMAAKWAPPTNEKSSFGRDELVFNQSPRVVAKDQGDNFVIQISPAPAPAPTAQ